MAYTGVFFKEVEKQGVGVPCDHWTTMSDAPAQHRIKKKSTQVYVPASEMQCRGV